MNCPVAPVFWFSFGPGEEFVGHTQHVVETKHFVFVLLFQRHFFSFLVAHQSGKEMPCFLKMKPDFANTKEQWP